MANTFDVQLGEALALLPAEGTIDFDEYKAQLYAVNPDGGKAVFQHILKNQLVGRKLDMSDKQNIKVLLSRKV